MTEQSSSEPGFWDDEAEDPNRKPTEVTRNPFDAVTVRVPTPLPPPLDGEDTEVLLLGAPKPRLPSWLPAERRSFYDRLTDSEGALGDLTAEKSDADAPLVLESFAAVQPAELPPLAETVRPMAPASAPARVLAKAEAVTVRPSAPDSPKARKSTPQNEAETVRPGELRAQPAHQLVAQRDSSEELRDSDLEAVSQPDLAPVPVAIPPAPALPSVVLSPQISTRFDNTERMSIASRSHPLTSSLSPAVAASSTSSGTTRSQAWKLAAAALVLIGAGVAVSQYQRSESQSLASSASANDAREAVPLAVVPTQRVPEEAPRAIAPIMPVNPLPALPQAPAEPALAQADATDDAPAAEPEPRAKRRDAARTRKSRVVRASERSAPAGSDEASEQAVADEVDGEEQGEADPGEPADTRPTQPEREQVVAIMQGMITRLEACTEGKRGSADVTLTVQGAGFVSHAVVGGTFAGTPEGSCIARVIKEASFPPFSKSSVRITYPFQL